MEEFMDGAWKEAGSGQGMLSGYALLSISPTKSSSEGRAESCQALIALYEAAPWGILLKCVIIAWNSEWLSDVLGDKIKQTKIETRGSEALHGGRWNTFDGCWPSGKEFWGEICENEIVKCRIVNTIVGWECCSLPSALVLAASGCSSSLLPEQTCLCKFFLFFFTLMEAWWFSNGLRYTAAVL